MRKYVLLTAKGDTVQEDVETREIRDTCASLSLPNRERAYEVACALKFAEAKPVYGEGQMVTNTFVSPTLRQV